MAWDDVKTPHEKLMYQIELKRDLRLHNGIDYVAWEALRAVVELHKPIETYNMNNVHKSWFTCTHCNDEAYPCETIQDIEKELK